MLLVNAHSAHSHDNSVLQGLPLSPVPGKATPYRMPQREASKVREATPPDAVLILIAQQCRGTESSTYMMLLQTSGARRQCNAPEPDQPEGNNADLEREMLGHLHVM
jgi:hypothetical protein